MWHQCKLFAIGIVMVVGSASSAEIGSLELMKFKEQSDEYKKLIENSVWVVPPDTLLAYEYLNGEHVAVSDQTVWVINRYDRGYFFGEAYTTINAVPSAQKKIVGSVTPLGDVYISFYPINNEPQEGDIINGIGVLKKCKGKYTFLMQMNSAQNSLTGLSHWSYMINVKPKSYFYQHLPGVGISVPEFISQF